jgi:hypothetical protein
VSDEWGILSTVTQDVITGVLGSIKNYQEYKDSSHWRCNDEQCWEIEDEEPKNLIKVFSYLVPEEHLTTTPHSPPLSPTQGTLIPDTKKSPLVETNQQSRNPIPPQFVSFPNNFKSTTMKSGISNIFHSLSSSHFDVPVFAKYCISSLTINVVSHQVLPFILHSLEGAAKDQFLYCCSALQIHLPILA